MRNVWAESPICVSINNNPISILPFQGAGLIISYFAQGVVLSGRFHWARILWAFSPKMISIMSTNTFPQIQRHSLSEIECILLGTFVSNDVLFDFEYNFQLPTLSID